MTKKGGKPIQFEKNLILWLLKKCRNFLKALVCCRMRYFFKALLILLPPKKRGKKGLSSKGIFLAYNLYMYIGICI